MWERFHIQYGVQVPVTTKYSATSKLTSCYYNYPKNINKSTIYTMFK